MICLLCNTCSRANKDKVFHVSENAIIFKENDTLDVNYDTMQVIDSNRKTSLHKRYMQMYNMYM